MKRTWLLLLVGLMPLLAGVALDAATPRFSQSYSVLLSAALLGLWGYLSYKVRRPQDTALTHAIMMQVPAFAVLLLVIYQVYVQGEFWPNAVGMMTQLYYLPVMALVARIARLFFDDIGLGLMFLVGFAVMLVASLVGGAMAKDA